MRHQDRAVDFLHTKRRAILADDPGLGKTATVVVAAKRLIDSGQAAKCLLVTKSSLIGTWCREIKRFTDFPFVAVTGTKAQKQQAISEFIESAPPYLVCSYETIRDFRKDLADVEWDVISLDEGTKIKNLGSARMAKAIHAYHAEYEWIVSGNPVDNDAKDLYNIFAWLGYEERSQLGWLEHYFEHRGYEYKPFPWAVERFNQKLNEIMIRRRRSEIREIPEYHEKIYVQLTEKQRRVYDQLENEVWVDIGRGLLITNPLARMTILKEAADSLELLDGPKESGKLPVIVELANQAIGSGQKVVIFTQFRKMQDAIVRELQHLNPAIIHGGVSTNAVRGMSKRDKEATRFNEDPDCKVIVGIFGAMGEGWNLPAGSVCILVDKPWKPKDWKQAKDRILRLTQKNDVCVYHIIAEGTIDEPIEVLLEEKEELFNSVVESRDHVDTSNVKLTEQDIALLMRRAS